MLDWNSASVYLVPKDFLAKKRETEWICSCDVCQKERSISYCQAFNILKSKSPRTCKQCRIELGLIKINISGLKHNKEIQQKATKNRIGKSRPKSKEIMKYRHLFNPESLANDSMKLKQRTAKLNKFGKDANAWTGSTNSTERTLASGRDDYKNLRKQVFARDNYCCVLCNTKGYLHMDHIKEWLNYPELRYDINNCRTLCPPCHRKTDNYGSKAKKLKVKNGN